MTALSLTVVLMLLNTSFSVAGEYINSDNLYEEASIEVCNGIDDDGDTFIDEDYVCLLTTAFPGQSWTELAPGSLGVDPVKLNQAMNYLASKAPPDGVDRSVVIRNGYLIWKGSEYDTVSHAWSVTKSFTGTILGLLLDEGKADLTTLAKDYLSTMEAQYPAVNLEHFATFTSGYNPSSQATFFVPATPNYVPGTMFHYSEHAIKQFANILTHIAEEELDSYFKRKIADPIQMDPDKWSWVYSTEIDGYNITKGDTGLTISAAQLARVGHVLLNNGTWNATQLLSEWWVNQATSVQVPASLPNYIPNDLPGRYGYHMWINDTGVDGQLTWPNVSRNTYAMVGHLYNFVFVIPELDIVIARGGTDGLFTDYFAGSPLDTFLGMITDSIVEYNTLTQLLPDTGQSKCYDNSQEITASEPGDPFFGQDVHFPCNPHSYSRLDENGSKLPDDATWPWAMVRDNVTGLIWEVKTDKDFLQNFDNPHDADNNYTWYDDSSGGPDDGPNTAEFINQLNTAHYGGYNDWRLPTLKELATIVDSSIPLPGPAINTDYFPNAESSHFWSSTPNAHYPDDAWFINFYQGYISHGRMNENEYFVRAVRGRQSSHNNFTDNGDGTITDSTTGLMWQQTSPPGTYTWEGALTYCDDLSLAQYNDWRLPNRNELQSIIDYNLYYPCIDPVFYSTESSPYWSSTTHTHFTAGAFSVGFHYGRVDHAEKPDHLYVRAVRGGQCWAYGDSDEDAIPNNQDNCPNYYNPLQEDTDGSQNGDACNNVIDADGDEWEDVFDNCLNHYNPLQEDSFPPEGNGIGDACECEGDFDCDTDQDGTDAAKFKMDFGRSSYVDPCNDDASCTGDFDTDMDVDGMDAYKFMEDFGRSAYNNACPYCVPGG